MLAAAGAIQADEAEGGGVVTCIAWDGKRLAGDRMVTSNGNAPFPTRKVFRVKTTDGRRMLIGLAGDTYDCTAFLRWVKNPEKDKQPTATGFSALVIDEKRRIWMIQEKLIYVQLHKRYHALGSGWQYALAAMECGRSSAQAVRVAARLDREVGMGVDVVRF